MILPQWYPILKKNWPGFTGDELKSGIVKGLDEIFHFKSFVFNLKKNELIYEPVFILGLDHQVIDGEFEISSGT